MSFNYFINHRKCIFFREESVQFRETKSRSNKRDFSLMVKKSYGQINKFDILINVRLLRS